MNVSATVFVIFNMFTAILTANNNSTNNTDDFTMRSAVAVTAANDTASKNDYNNIIVAINETACNVTNKNHDDVAYYLELTSQIAIIGTIFITFCLGTVFGIKRYRQTHYRLV